MAYPEVAADSGVIVPDANILAYLREAMPGARDTLPASAKDTDPDKQAAYQTALLVSAFSVDPGADQRQLGYPVRIGLLVVAWRNSPTTGGDGNREFFIEARLASPGTTLSP